MSILNLLPEPAPGMKVNGDIIQGTVATGEIVTKGDFLTFIYKLNGPINVKDSYQITDNYNTNRVLLSGVNVINYNTSTLKYLSTALTRAGGYYQNTYVKIDNPNSPTSIKVVDNTVDGQPGSSQSSSQGPMASVSFIYNDKLYVYIIEYSWNSWGNYGSLYIKRYTFDIDETNNTLTNRSSMSSLVSTSAGSTDIKADYGKMKSFKLSTTSYLIVAPSGVYSINLNSIACSKIITLYGNNDVCEIDTDKYLGYYNSSSYAQEAISIFTSGGAISTKSFNNSVNSGIYGDCVRCFNKGNKVYIFKNGGQYLNMCIVELASDKNSVLNTTLTNTRITEISNPSKFDLVKLTNDQFLLVAPLSSLMSYYLITVNEQDEINIIDTVRSGSCASGSLISIDEVQANEFIVQYTGGGTTSGKDVFTSYVIVSNGQILVREFNSLTDTEQGGIAMQNGIAGDIIDIAIPYIQHPIVYDLDNCSISSAPTHMTSADEIVFTVNPNQYYDLPNLINVSGATAEWSVTNNVGTLTLKNATGNVSVTIVSEFVGYSVEFYNGSTLLLTQNIPLSVSTSLDGSNAISGLSPMTSFNFAGWGNGSTYAIQYSLNQQVTNLAGKGQIVRLYTVQSRTFQAFSGINRNNSDTLQNATQYYSSNGTYDYLSTITLPSSMESITGWNSRGYRLDTNSADKVYNLGQVIAIPTSTTNTEFLGVYAKQGSATFYSGVTEDTVNNVQAIAYYNTNDATTPSTCDFRFTSAASISGWTFAGWRTDMQDSSPTYLSSNSIPLPFSGGAVYAVYSKDVTIVYDGNGEDSGTIPSETNTVYLNTHNSATTVQIIFAQNQYTKTGYRFNGWSCYGSTYQPGNTGNIGFNYSQVPNTITVTAIWTSDSSGNTPNAPTITLSGTTLSIQNADLTQYSYKLYMLIDNQYENVMTMYEPSVNVLDIIGGEALFAGNKQFVMTAAYSSTPDNESSYSNSVTYILEAGSYALGDNGLEFIKSWTNMISDHEVEVNGTSLVSAVFTPETTSDAQYLALPNTLTILLTGCLSNCEFQGCFVPASVVQIEDNVFSYSKLEIVAFENNGANILDFDTENAFTESMISATPTLTNLTTIGDYMFKNCTNLSQAVIDTNVVAIGVEAFAGCETIMEIIVLNPIPPTLSTDALPTGSASYTIYVPQGELNTYKNNTDWKHYEDLGNAIIQEIPW